MQFPLWLQHGIEMYGYWVVLAAVALESMGVPFPGETALLAGAVYAGTTGRMNVAGVIVAAAVGAILGDNIGFTVGHVGGYPLLRRIARLFHIEDKSLHYAERYFARHGDKTVFLGRFFSLLRTYVAFLAGVNRMPWRTFLVWNATGGIVWAIVYGLLGFILGRNLPLLGTVLRIIGTGGIVALGLFIVTVVVFWLVRRRRLIASPDRSPAKEGTSGASSASAADEQSSSDGKVPSRDDGLPARD